MSLSIAIIGSGPAAVSAVQTLQEKNRTAAEPVRITVVSRDRSIASRVLLTEYLAGRRDSRGLDFAPDAVWEDKNTTLYMGREVLAVRAGEHRLCCADGEMPYDRLIICCGSKSFVPDIPGLDRDAENVVCSFHDPEDVERIAAFFGRGLRFAVLGGGFIGLDVASALLERGEKTSIIEGAPRIVFRQTDETASEMFLKRFEAHGAETYLGRSVAACERDERGRCCALRLKDGTRVPFDVLIVAAGVRPRTELLESAGVLVNGRAAVDEYLRTPEPDIYLAGDNTGLTGVWSEAVRQGRIAALNCLGCREAYPHPFTLQNTLHFFDLALMSVGILEPEENGRVICRQEKNRYIRLVYRGDTLSGVLIVGDLHYAGIWHRLVAETISLEQWQALLEEGRLNAADLYGSNASAQLERRRMLLSGCGN